MILGRGGLSSSLRLRERSFIPKAGSVTNEGYQGVSVRHYFVDEAGDATLFNRRKKVAVGKEGCSSFFILGLLDVEDPEGLAAGLRRLRENLRADPYFRNVPSMQPECGKTAVAFHATDDLPEVRREVFRVLMEHPMKFFAVARDKRAVVSYVHQRNERDASYRYHPNELYDHLVRRLFRDRLHKHDGYRIVFAKRGASDRTSALREGLDGARRNFEKKHGVVGMGRIEVLPMTPRQTVGLQAVDYFLWALQRLYERGEVRFIQTVWPAVSLVHDVDDTRERPYGEYYTQDRPLDATAIKKRMSGI